MKVTSIEYVFDNGAVVTFVKQSNFYNVRIENKNGSFNRSTHASPSQVLAKTFLQNSMKELTR